MMFYIIYAITTSETIAEMRGGASVSMILNIGIPLIGIFSLFFFLYMNSFLTKQRNKEYALYSILGMNKRNIVRIMFWDNLMVATASIVSGVLLGIVFYKIFELGLMNILRAEINFDLSLNVISVIVTIIVYAAIFCIVLVRGIVHVVFTNLSKLLKSENLGEKPIKANWIFGMIGCVLLGGAYYIALTMKDPLEAITMFFVAVLLVSIGTYLLFISGSVILCKVLQKNKKYYYKPRNFLTVSAMAFRMRRNGAGLATICIFITAVLVMVSSTLSLYLSEEELLEQRFPREITMNLSYAGVESVDEEAIETIRQVASEKTEVVGGTVVDEMYYKRIMTAGQMVDGVFEFLPSNANGLEDIYQVFFLDIEDYNRIYETNIELNPDEAMVHGHRTEFKEEQIQITDGLQYQVVEVVDELWSDSIAVMNVFPSIMIIVEDFTVIEDGLAHIQNSMGESILTSIGLAYYFNTGLEGDAQVELQYNLEEAMAELFLDDPEMMRSDIESRTAGESDFYGLYGGLFFVGIILSILFVSATVLIIYYKQIVEGYEDRGRFEIMKKVGITKKEIKRSINTQVLTVFFLPLVAAGIHLCFAFSIIKQLLLMFNLSNVLLIVLSMGICFVVFGVFYGVIYFLTSRTYYRIVSES